MKKLEFTICAGIGDNLVIRVFFDTIKHNYDQIKISHSKNVVNFWRNGDPSYYKFLNDLGKLLFSDPPYIFDQGKYPDIQTEKIIRDLKIIPVKPNLDHLLCVGQSLNLGEEYIIITTKIRGVSKKLFYPLSIQLWETLRILSQKYKIVIMGERDLERSKEYSDPTNMDLVHSIYEQIITNLPADRIVDLTVPALGITVPNLSKIQQDCLIMKEAKFVITLGFGGNLWLAVSVANTIGFRGENDYVTNLINNPNFSTVFVTQDWNNFINKLKEYK